jgi:hypothetical protein
LADQWYGAVKSRVRPEIRVTKHDYYSVFVDLEQFSCELLHNGN